MKKKMMEALKDLNAYIDNDREKLCDRVYDLELSHIRMRKLLKVFLCFVETVYEVDKEFDVGFSQLCEYLHKLITLELYGLENYKGLKHE